MSFYQIDVQAAGGANVGDSNVKFAQAFGDLDTINYIARKVVKEIEGLQGNIVLNLDEVDAIGGQPVREVVELVANAKVVATVLKGELTTERKAARTAPADSSRPSPEDLADPVGGGEGYLEPSRTPLDVIGDEPAYDDHAVN